MAGQPSKYDIWSSTWVCRDGEQVPIPPEQLGGLRAYLALSLRWKSWWPLLAIYAVGVLALAMLSGRFGWSDLLYVGGVAIGGIGLLAVALPMIEIIVSLAFWPLTRVQAGETARQSTITKPLDALEAEINDCETRIAQAPLHKRWQYERRADWLRRQRAQRAANIPK